MNIDYDEIGKEIPATNKMKHALEHGDLNDIAQNSHNDFEHSVFQFNPELHNIKKQLLELGCLSAFMTGSGSTIVGITESQEQAAEIQQKLNYKTIIAQSR